MNKAFIFDMDGVIVDSENAWREYALGFFEQLVGSKIAKKVGDLIGMSVNEEYEKSVKYGLSIPKDIFVKAYDEKAAYVYSKSNITQGVDKLVKELIELGYKIGLVSSSRQNWINHVLKRLSFTEEIKCVISINDQGFPPKPNPAAYKETIKKLDATADSTIIIEDSNRGIQAAKAAGAFVIGFRGNLVDGYQQHGADAYAGTMREVIKIVESIKLPL